MPRVEPHDAGDRQSVGGPTPPRGLATRIVRAMSAQMATQGLRIVQQLMLLPLFLRAWGIDIYTDWLLINAGVALLSIADGGMQPYFSGLLQERRVQADLTGYLRSAKIACFNYLIVILAALAVAAIVTFAADWRGILGLKALSRHDADLTLALLFANGLMTLPFGIAGSLYKANGEYDRGVLVNLGTLAIQIAIPASLLALDQPITILATGNLISSLIGWAFVSLDQRIRYGGLPWGLAVPTRPELRAIVTECLFFTAQPIATWLTIQGPLMILGQLGTPAETIAFTTARTLVGVSRQLTLQLAYPFGFELSLLLMRNQLPELRRLLDNAVSVIGIIGGFLAGMVMVAGPTVGVPWLHGRIMLSPSLVTALAIPVAISASSQLYQLVLVFSNRPRLVAKGVMAYAALGIMLALVLEPPLGVVGVAAGLGIGETVALVLYLPSRTFHMLGMRGGALQRGGLLRSAAATAISYAIASMTARIIPPNSIFHLIAFGGLWAVASGLCAFILLLDRSQRAVIEMKIFGAPRDAP